MEIVYSIFIGTISSKIVGMIDGIVLQCRRDTAGKQRHPQQQQRARQRGSRLALSTLK